MMEGMHMMPSNKKMSDKDMAKMMREKKMKKKMKMDETKEAVKKATY